MDENIPLSGQIDLDALDDYLVSDHAPDNGMGLSDLDGFLTGIVVGPELILPSEWLPVIWGGAEPVFETEAKMWTVLGTIMGRYNEIVTCLDSEPESFEPIFMEGPEGEVIASDWAAGFLDAVALRAKAWEPLIEHDRAGIMMLPILLLNGEAELEAGPDSAIDEDEFLAEVRDIIQLASLVFTTSGKTTGLSANHVQAAVEAAPETAGAIKRPEVGVVRSPLYRHLRSPAKGHFAVILALGNHGGPPICGKGGPESSSS